MVSPRSVIIARDIATGRAWSGSLLATGASVEIAEDLATVDPDVDLMVAEYGPPAQDLTRKLSQLSASSSAIVVVDQPNLRQATQQLRVPAVKSVIVKEYMYDSMLTTVAAKQLWGNVFGLSKIIPFGARITTEVVGGHDDRTQALASLRQFASALRLRAKYREALFLVAEELLMNALYDAPIDARGAHVFEDVAPKDRGAVRLERPAVLQFASDGSRVLLAARDSFGSLERSMVLDCIERCAKSPDQIDRKTSGAGLGLYLVANHVTELVFNVLPGVATEVICVIDLRQMRERLMHFGFHQESVAAPSEEGQSRRLVGAGSAPAPTAATPAVVQVTLAAAVLTLLAAAVLLAWPYLQSKPKGTVEIVSEPPGAVIYLNGARRGQAAPKLVISDLETDKPYAITANLTGYAEAKETVTLKADERLDVRLALSRLGAKLRVTSSPSGATIKFNGNKTGQRTPALIEGLDPDKEHVVELSLYGFKSAKDIVKVVADRTLLYHTKLNVSPRFAVARLRSTPSGARLLVNDVDTGLKTPITGHVLRAQQKYVLSLVLPGRVPWRRAWSPRNGDELVESIKLRHGGFLTLTSNIPARVQVGDEKTRLPLRNRMLPVGNHRLRVFNGRPALEHVVQVTIARGARVNRALKFGYVAAPRPWRVGLPGRRPQPKAAIPVGAQQVTLVNPRTKAKKTVQVEVVARETVNAPAE